MKAVLLALLCGMSLFSAMSVTFKLTRVEARARFLLNTYLVFLVVMITVHLSTPIDLGFLPSAMVMPIEWVDLAFAIFLFSTGFFGGVLQLYNLADRGFSLRILIDILESPSAGLTLAEVMTGYSCGHGIDWMYQKRIDGMTTMELVRISDGYIRLTPKGERIGKIFAWLQDFACGRARKAPGR